MKQLKTYLIINSIFSAISGLIMLVFVKNLNDLFGINNAYVFPIIGVNLLVFSAFVLIVSIKQLSNRILVSTITILDLLWVLGSLVIVVFGLFSISKSGNILIGVVAIWIAILTYKQFQHNK